MTHPIRGVPVRLRTPQEKADKMSSMARITMMMMNLGSDVKVESSDVSSRAPDANIADVSSALMMEDKVVWNRDGYYRIRVDAEVIDVPEHQVAAYYYCNQHLKPEDRDDELYESIRAIGLNVGVPVPGRVCDVDGQLKIATEVVMAIDALVHRKKKERYKILVVGSSAESGVCGIAYDIIPAMQLSANLEIHLYDPYERDYDEIINYNDMSGISRESNFKHYRDYFKYESLTKERAMEYDLLLDDAFVIGANVTESHRRLIDMRRCFEWFSDYSIKWLPSDDEYFMGSTAIRFRQLFKTQGKESRAIKYQRYYTRLSSEVSLGRCGACSDLAYTLRGTYGEKFTMAYMMAHKKACVVWCPSRVRAVVSDCCSRVLKTRVDASRGSCGKFRICGKHETYLPLFALDKREFERNVSYVEINKVGHYSELSREVIKLNVSSVMETLVGTVIVPVVDRVYQYEVNLLNDVVVFAPGTSVVYCTHNHGLSVVNLNYSVVVMVECVLPDEVVKRRDFESSNEVQIKW